MILPILYNQVEIVPLVLVSTIKLTLYEKAFRRERHYYKPELTKE